MHPSTRVRAAGLAAVVLLACCVVSCTHTAPLERASAVLKKLDLTAAPGSATRTPLAGDFAIVNVTVIDADGGIAHPDQTVLVSGDRISAVGSSSTVRPQTGVPTIDGTGKFLIPGLWDMHVHASDARTWPVFLRHGVTGMRHMFSLTPGISELKADPSEGSVRPRVVATTRMLDGERSRIPFPFSTRVLKADTAAPPARGCGN